MKQILTILFSIISFCNSFSQIQWWAEQNSGVTATLTSISVTATFGAVWVCGYNGIVLRTNNNGTNWISVGANGIPSNVQLINICAIDGNTALVAGYIGTTNTWVWKTTNGGTNWTQVFNQPNGFIDGIKSRGSNTSRLFMIGDPVGGRWSIWKSINLGNTWDSTGLYLPQAGTETGYNNSLFWNNYNNQDSSIWFGTNNFRIYRSTNSGSTWIAQSTGTEQNIYAIMGLGIDLFVGGASLQRSQNFGNNWSNVTTPGSGNFGGLVVFGVPVDNINNVGASWYVRSDNNIYFGYDFYGMAVQYTATTGNYRYISTGYGPIWAVRDNGGISACVSCGASGVTSISNEMPSKFSLKQNYPNPFNPETVIEFGVPKTSQVKIEIFDNLGKSIEVLGDQRLTPGTYLVKWNAAKYSSGVYFYRLSSEDFIQTKKMVLIK
jgi:photosystem II stability/assembly factor-like uncharacterized protein